MDYEPIAGPSTSSTRLSASRPVLDDSWTQVETLPDADDSDYEQEEEVAYITLDFGSDLSPEILSQLETFQLASLNSKQPWARLGDNFLRGVHERTLGSDIIFVSRPPDPDTGKPTLLEPFTTTSSRIRFEKVILTPKTSSSTRSSQIERPSASAFLAPPKRGVRGGSGYKAGGGPGGGANRGKKNASAIAKAGAAVATATGNGTRRKRGQKETPLEEEGEEDAEDEGADLNEEDGEADYKEDTPDATLSTSARKTRAKKNKETPAAATPSSEGRKTRSRNTTSATTALPPLPPPEAAAAMAQDAPPLLDEEGMSQCLQDQGQDVNMEVENDEGQASNNSAFIGLQQDFPDIEEF